MAKKKKEPESAASEVVVEASATEAPQEVAQGPQDAAAVPEGTNTAPDEETPQGKLEAVVETPEETPPETPERNAYPPDEIPEETPDDFRPYKARVTPALLACYSEDGTPVGTILRGAEVAVAARAGEYARLDNGIFVKEAFLAPV